MLLRKYFCGSFYSIIQINSSFGMPRFSFRLLVSFLQLFYFNKILTFKLPGAIGTLESVPDLEKAMYLNMESFPCVRLLNLSGEIGCASKCAQFVSIVFWSSNINVIFSAFCMASQIASWFLEAADNHLANKNSRGFTLGGNLKISFLA